MPSAAGQMCSKTRKLDGLEAWWNREEEQGQEKANDMTDVKGKKSGKLKPLTAKG